MKGIILLNGEPYAGKINADGALVYCCDGAYNWAKGKVRIDKNIGDFDSLDIVPDPVPEEIYPAEKNFTDGEIAMSKLLEAGADDIEIYGGFGGREDHFIGNIHLLYRAFKAGAKCAMISEKTKIFLGSGVICMGEYFGCTVSVLPFGGTLHIMGSEGLKYSYPDIIGYGECRGISNIVQSNSAELKVEGVALVIINGGTL